MPCACLAGHPPALRPWWLGLCNGCCSFFHLLFPGCELTASTKSYTFQVDEEDDSDHILALSVVCLTDGAKDECNVVEVVGRNHENQEIAVPVANLKLSCQPLLSLDNFKLQPPVTFRLAAGSGPVRLAGWHRIVHREDASFEEDDDLSEEEEQELAPIMPAKK
uniref:Nucleoplasmin-3 n=1 Tax=Falco tinnunculus TaxID=100819 RepID=A0A8C4TQK1_FALTI